MQIINTKNRYLGIGRVNTRALYCRKRPQVAYSTHGRFRRGEEIPLYECAAAGWYETRWQGQTGYVMALFVDALDGENSTEKGKTCEETPWHLGKVSSRSLNVRKEPKGALLGLHPKNRYCLLQESENSDYYRSLWKGKTAYLAKAHILKLESADADYAQRLRRMAFAEQGRSEPEAFAYYGAAVGSKWCQSFANWLALHAGAKPANVPKTNSTPRAIVYHVLEGAGFRFVNAGHKAKMRRFSSLLASQTEPALTEEEQAYTPKVGDFVYFRWNNKPSDHCSHVGVVLGVDVEKKTMQVLEGNMRNRVCLRVWSWKDEQIVGYGMSE